MSGLKVTGFDEIIGSDQNGQSFTKFVVFVKPEYAPYHEFKLNEIVLNQVTASKDLTYSIWFDSRVTSPTATLRMHDGDPGSCFATFPIIGDPEKIRQTLMTSPVLFLDIEGHAGDKISFIDTISEMMGDITVKNLAMGSLNYKRKCGYSVKLPTVTL